MQEQLNHLRVSANRKLTPIRSRDMRRSDDGNSFFVILLKWLPLVSCAKSICVASRENHFFFMSFQHRRVYAIETTYNIAPKSKRRCKRHSVSLFFRYFFSLLRSFLVFFPLRNVYTQFDDSVPKNVAVSF